jgi:hypothetical protein
MLSDFDQIFPNYDELESFNADVLTIASASDEEFEAAMTELYLRDSDGRGEGQIV